MRLTLKELGDIVNAYVDETKIGQTDFQASHNSISNLIDKIGKVFTIDNAFQDKLGIFDREDLPLGTTVEEWYQSLNLPQDYNENGDNTLAPSYPEYAPVCYSYSLGRKVIKTTIKQNTYERACNSAAEAATLVNMVTKRLFDSFALYKYGVKKEALGKIVSKIYDNYDGGEAFDGSMSYSIGEHESDSAGGIHDAVCVKNYPGGSVVSSLREAIDQGYFVAIEMAVTMANPLEAAAGEARQAALKEFLIQIKRDVETASFATEGNSFNGNTIGSEEGLVLIVPKSIMPLMEVELESGAFNLDKLAIPAQIIVVDELKDNGIGINPFGMLLDPRMVSVHNIYQAIREQNNAEGDFVNEYLHVELNVHVSNNTFCKVYAADWNI